MLNGPQTSLIGAVSILQQRLVVHELPVRLIDGFLGLMSVLAIWVIYCARNSRCATRDPFILQGFATVLAASPAFVEVARTCEFFRQDKHTIQQLSQQTFNTAVEKIRDTNTFRIVPSFSSQATSSGPGNQKQGVASLSWWQPIPLNWHCWVVMVLMFAGVATALEILLHVSNTNSGIGSVDNESRLHYTWTVLPATVMALLAMYVGAFDFNLKCLAPYFKLHQASTADRSIRLRLPDQFVPFTVIDAFRTRLFAVLFSTLAGFIAAFLTIVVSGIFSLSRLSYTEQTTVLGTSSFNASIDPNVGYFGNGMAVASLVLYNNYSQPLGTYQDLALPGIAIDDNLHKYHLRSSHAATISTLVAALRSKLDCKLFPSLDTLCSNLTFG